VVDIRFFYRPRCIMRRRKENEAGRGNGQKGSWTAQDRVRGRISGLRAKADSQVGSVPPPGVCFTWGTMQWASLWPSSVIKTRRLTRRTKRAILPPFPISLHLRPAPIPPGHPTFSVRVSSRFAGNGVLYTLARAFPPPRLPLCRQRTAASSATRARRQHTSTV